ncbi:gephyrin-like molybdotransferase Glp [Palleronia sp. LCG004]|uniref:molybdopterin molybdotransferase MoeA n=1 Tax=Palleronia sp. LCG004 TaxID=3079304 RepID=UPI002941D59D|nr:gephyrin-like molybdotransferase Glp [Palleronia sp. LCG004]WOI55035.1 molybdopterin molybdotransferase MoeA [Palleronia sp. LCG004]
MISVAEALDRIFGLVSFLGTEDIPLRHASGRIATEEVAARLSQPPFDASAMDGYAIAADTPVLGESFEVIGESAAGHRYDGSVGPGQAVRIFTGAPVPRGAVRVILQEEVSRRNLTITLDDLPRAGRHIRPAGGDFAKGQSIAFDQPLRPVDLALVAAMGHGTIRVARRPEVAIIATGNELVAPGDLPGPDQIVASNHLGLAAMVERSGGIARLLPIASDNEASLAATFDLARGCDLIVTIGGASVGDHDLVGKVAADRGMERSFYKVAMRPGKPLMAGRLDGIPMIGLPGNPVSSLVCGEVFVRPALEVMLGRPARPAPRAQARLAHDLAANGPREHYMRATLDANGIRVADSQDSAMLGILTRSNALLVREPNEGPHRAGDIVNFIAI